MGKMQQEERGITEKIYKAISRSGAQAITMGNHTWDNRDIFEFIDHAKYLVQSSKFSRRYTW